MSDSPLPIECFVCEEPIESEDDLVMFTDAGWQDCEFTVQCHRECTQEAG